LHQSKKLLQEFFNLLLKDKAASAEIELCITTPKMAPRTIAISICEVKFDVIDFSCVFCRTHLLFGVIIKKVPPKAATFY
jgi:hypothetical protein